MLTTLPTPVLSVTPDAVKDLQGRDALSALWTIFTKCKESLQDGRRLENISWRLWHRELILAQQAYLPPTPDSSLESQSIVRYPQLVLSPYRPCRGSSAFRYVRGSFPFSSLLISRSPCVPHM
ncbi:hypothetical protein F4604DRAFT_1571197 [Suillus subluteus]|nr:hypothetical protein F4604DRAFT_1571197 [Suillus subluteus]